MVIIFSKICPFWLAFYCWCILALTEGKKWILIDSLSSEVDSSSKNKELFGIDQRAMVKGGTCFDRITNQDETDIDCGGTICPKCNNTMNCKENCDCISNSCENKKCIPFQSCDDNTRNQGEADIDCGGPKCPKCEITKTCDDNHDCLSDVCKNHRCVQAETCKDNIKNQDETDIDCGGILCPKCGDQKTCEKDCDCISDTCKNNTCYPICEPKCQNHGICTIHKNCSCTTGFTGPACEVQSVGLCHDNETLGKTPILLIDFGNGSSQFSRSTPDKFNFRTTYTQRFQPTIEDGYFGFINSVYNHNNNAWHTNALDHTEDNGGYMFLVNANFQPGQFYNGIVHHLCVGLRYEFSVYLANVLRSADGIKPNVRFEVRSPAIGNELLAQLRSGEIPVQSNLTWNKYGLSFTAPSSTVVLLMISDAPGGRGNDIVIDDIGLRVCAHEGSGFCPPE